MMSITDQMGFLQGFYKSFFSLLLNFNFSDLEILKKEIETNSLLNHPAIFETLLAFIADLFKIYEIKNIYELSHSTTIQFTY